MHALVASLFWLMLSTWFGAVLLSAIVPPIVLRVTREADPTLPRVLSVNLDAQHSTLLASMIVGELLSVLFKLQAVCATVLLPALVGQWFFVDRSGVALMLPIMVSGLYVGAVLCLVYGWRVVLPKVLRHRATYIEHADDPDVANAELDRFDRYSNELFSVVRNLLFALLGMILFSANFLPTAASLLPK
ncbi:MAG TPA: hypothetical protein VF595_10430 [Tepidisphaeraceae bacterium]|jgi:hypothetical protein